MPFTYRRVIRFGETDAAGVVYFAALLNLCHEAYEEAIASIQTSPAINPRQFFSGAADTAVPIVHTAADFYQPLFCGDTVSIQLTPKQLTPHSFEIAYIITGADGPDSDYSGLAQSRSDVSVRAITRHVCISIAPRRRVALSPALLSWIATLAASAPEPPKSDD